MPETVEFPSLGYVIDDLPENILNELKCEVEYTREDKIEANHILAGNISTEYSVNKERLSEEFYNYLFSLVNLYDNKFAYTKNINILTDSLPYTVSSMWVNYQKKYEFNPIHDHSGVFSFVIWIKIPYNLSEELLHPCSVKSNNQCPSVFSFHFVNHLGKILTHRLDVDKSFEGKIILFPACLSHSVNPFFTSDDERISIAGNIALDSRS